ncbi:unnamed protein product, partial [Staurois parvus]
TGPRPVISCWHLAIAEHLRRGRDLCCFVWLWIANPYKAVCLKGKALTQHTEKQHTVNPLISHVNLFLPSAISTVSVLFISTDHCIGVTGDVSSPV